eukprot:scaffold10163_cov71-Cyclotella_meneghiniana.AAC.1
MPLFVHEQPYQTTNANRVRMPMPSSVVQNGADLSATAPNVTMHLNGLHAPYANNGATILSYPATPSATNVMMPLIHAPHANIWTPTLTNVAIHHHHEERQPLYLVAIPSHQMQQQTMWPAHYHLPSTTTDHFM